MIKVFSLKFGALLLSLLSFFHITAGERGIANDDLNITNTLLPITNASVSDVLTYALLSQRSILSEQRFSTVPTILMNISSVLNVNSSLNASDATLTLSNIIKSGVDGFLIDLEYDTDNKNWRIYNQNDTITLDFVLSALNSFVYGKFSVTKIRFFNVLLNVVNVDEISIDYDMLNQLENIISNTIEIERIFTSADLNNYIGWPPLKELLLASFSQVSFQLVNVASNSTNLLISNDKLNFINEDLQNYTCPLINKNDTKILTYKASTNYSVNSLNKAIYCGYKVVISNSFETLNETLRLLNTSLVWGWGFNQPATGNSNYGEYDGFASTFGSGDFYGCASLNTSQVFDSEMGNDANLNDYLWWDVANCYDPKRCLCKKPGILDSWEISTVSTDFFDLRSNSMQNAKSHGCSDGSFFSLPSTPLEILSLYKYLRSLNNDTLIEIIKQHGIWIELNSISLSTCWVVGDYTTDCPYAQFINRRNFIKMITPLAVTGGCLMIASFLLKLKKLPTQSDNKRWKRYTKEFASKSDPDGVPY